MEHVYFLSRRNPVTKLIALIRSFLSIIVFGEWMYLPGTLTTPQGMPARVKCMTPASVPPLDGTLN